ncbi:MAG: arginine--tRNA ligase [Proteobacteria bacterium]|nr:arginine--tRNA ligase [Pseudomonadota bacterium]
MIRKRVVEIINEACDICKTEGILPYDVKTEPIIEIPREEEFGDYSTNIAFLLAPKIRKSPQDIAKILIGRMHFGDVCNKVELAGKGFINFYIKDEIWRQALSEIFNNGLEASMPDVGKGKKVLMEFVSSNPTGPLHIGHGRGAAVGDVLANILKKTGYNVVKEYYVNDAGKQIDTLGESTYARWRELKGEDVVFEDSFYKGAYVKDIAADAIKQGLIIPEDRKEAIDFFAKFAGDTVLDGIKSDLESFGVFFDNYFSETTLHRNGIVEATLESLKTKGYAYEQEGALWFKTSLFEKDEDRVLIKSDGEKTYFASDIAYHKDKFNRSFDILIDIWGSDHHGYIPRMKAGVEATGGRKEDLKVLLIQFVTLLEDGKPVGMSTRSGQFTTLREVLDEVGKDAARFFFLMRKSDAHLEFDLDLAKKTSSENPVYYVQYAYARIASIFRNAKEDGIDIDFLKAKAREQTINGDVALEGDAVRVDLLTVKEEIDLIKSILHLYDILEGSSRSLEPHRITFYLIELVSKFHSYYNKTRILKNEKDLTIARLLLLYMLQYVIKYGLDILGVSTPEKM